MILMCYQMNDLSLSINLSLSSAKGIILALSFQGSICALFSQTQTALCNSGRRETLQGKEKKKTRLTDKKFRGKHISILRDHFKWMDFYAVKSVNVLE